MIKHYWELLGYYKGMLLCHRKELFYYLRKLVIYRDTGPAQEMVFWSRIKHYEDWDLFKQDLFNRGPDVRKALNEIGSRFGVSDRDLKVLEIGPGPRTGLAPSYFRGEYDLVGVDPLADEYKREFGGGNFLRKGGGEDIAEMFPAESFHIVYASNSLDHCFDPSKVMVGVSKVLKDGGIFIVSGNVREGSRLRWQGYHKHDLWVDGDKLMHSDRSGKTSVLIGDGFDLVKERVMTYDWEGAKIKWFYGEWRKR
jgi:SAM-dependent methyltransferase